MEHLELHQSSEPSHAFLLTNLNKFTSYQVVIQGANSQGEGPPSTSVVATTLEDGKEILFALFPFTFKNNCSLCMPSPLGSSYRRPLPRSRSRLSAGGVVQAGAGAEERGGEGVPGQVLPEDAVVW